MEENNNDLGRKYDSRKYRIHLGSDISVWKYFQWRFVTLKFYRFLYITYKYYLKTFHRNDINVAQFCGGKGGTLVCSCLNN